MLSKCLNSIKLSVTVVCIISFLSSLLLCPVENHYTDIQSHSLMQAFCVYLHLCQETRGGDLTETIPERSALEGGSPEFTLKWSGQVLYSWNEIYTSISFTRGIIHNTWRSVRLTSDMYFNSSSQNKCHASSDKCILPFHFYVSSVNIC